MKTRAVIMAGGDGSRLSVLTAKRTKPAVPFAGKYRIIDFTLSNCVNSGIFDVMVLGQYRPHSLIEHIGAGGPWDLNRDFTGGVRILTPYRGRFGAEWYVGTADAVQQNFTFIKQTRPDHILILSGDHVYAMDYDAMLTFHRDQEAELTMATVRVPLVEASRMGVLGVDKAFRVTSFVEKPPKPPSDLANMGVYIFNMEVLDRVLWEDHLRDESSHDFGKDIIPRMVAEERKVFAYPYTGYWVDVGTVHSYWLAHMDLLAEQPRLDLNDRGWVIHTRTEERPPLRVARGALAEDSLICDGCILEPGAVVERSVLSPGSIVRAGARVCESVILTNAEIGPGAVVERAILDKGVRVGERARIGEVGSLGGEAVTGSDLALVGKASEVPPLTVISPGGTVGSDVIASDYPSLTVKYKETIETKRKPYEI
ncbi:MAG: glucose-1-phosphate adenylyltransferase [Anaerolineales bacterium]|nr:glucose-1-phosphate adenylyltransferase [Anaerolineales bacterium]